MKIQWIMFIILVLILGSIIYILPKQENCPELIKIDCVEGRRIIIDQNTNCPLSVCIENQMELCDQNNGNWTSFPNSCADRCGEEICNLLGIISCDCGPDSCWNGVSCISG